MQESYPQEVGRIAVELPLNQILLGDALDVLRTLPDNSIDACITSPPYFQLCDYETPGQYGLEPIYQQYIAAIGEVFYEVHRLLKNGACCWIVIGDTMNNYSPVRAKGQRRKAGEYRHRRPMQPNYQEKECLSIPNRLTSELRLSDWVHRQTFIWDKGTSGGIANSDSAPLTHEFILQMGKWEKTSRPYLNCKPIKSSVLHYPPTSDPVHPCPFPVALAAQLIEASTEPGQTVIDPFMGAGTTALAALQLQRNFVGIELNPEYRTRALDRLHLAPKDRIGKAEALCC